MTDPGDREQRLIQQIADVNDRLAECERLLAESRHERERLRTREELYRQLVENSQGLICMHDLAGKLLYVSPASARELGYPPDAGAGRNLREFLAPAVRPFFDGYFERIAEKGSDDGVLRLVDSDGEERLWAYRNVLHGSPEGEQYVVGHAIDITDRVRAEALLRDSEARQRAVINALEEGVILMRADGTVEAWNPSAERILGRSAEQLGAQPDAGLARDALRDDGSPFPPAEFPGTVTLETGQPCSGVVMGMPRPDGRVVWISANSRPLSRTGEPTPRGVVVSFTDITERRRVEQQREKDLREALARVKVLGGILSICASCKRIRDHTNTWWPLEVYIRDHSEAEFSHGLCPDCVEESRRELRGQWY